MSETKFTPGPWVVVLEKDDYGQPCASVRSATEPYSPEYPNHRKAVTGWGCVRQSVADARLIAAAPDGYALAEEVANHLYTLQDIARVRQMAKEFISKVAGK